MCSPPSCTPPSALWWTLSLSWALLEASCCCCCVSNGVFVFVLWPGRVWLRAGPVPRAQCQGWLPLAGDQPGDQEAGLTVLEAWVWAAPVVLQLWVSPGADLSFLNTEHLPSLGNTQSEDAVTAVFRMSPGNKLVSCNQTEREGASVHFLLVSSSTWSGILPFFRWHCKSQR